MIPLLEGWLVNAKKASPHEVRLTPLDTNPVFQCLGTHFLVSGKNGSLRKKFSETNTAEFFIFGNNIAKTAFSADVFVIITYF